MIDYKFISLIFFCFVACSSSVDEKITLNTADIGLVDVIATDLFFEQRTNSMSLSFKNNLKSIYQKVSFDSLLNTHGQIAILRINDNNCGLCIEVELEEVLSFKEKMGTNQIAIFATFNTERNLKLMVKGLSGSNIPIYTLPSGELSLPVDEVNAPYYFTINTAHIVNHTFVPIRGVEALNESYFKAVAEVFKSSND
jgi:hypothetical protein